MVRVASAAGIGGLILAAAPAAAQVDPVIRLSPEHFDVPEFSAYEVEYGSAFGRFFNEVRPFELDGTPKISVLNLIDMPGAVIVDSRVLDGATLRLEHMASPFFAWGQEYAVGQSGPEGFEWVRIPLGGGEPLRSTGEAEYGGFVDDLGFSPTLAALMPMDVGATFRLPGLQARSDGTMGSTLLSYEVVGREPLRAVDGVACECWVIEQAAQDGVHRFWISREAPFLIKRHRDIGGPRDFVSEILSFRRF